MRRLMMMVAAIAIIATQASAQVTGETVSFPLGAGEPYNRITFVTRTKNTNFFSETVVKHSVRAANVGIFNIINGRLDIGSATQYNVVRFYIANCDTLTYTLYAQTEGIVGDLNANIMYATTLIDKPIGGTTPEGIRAGEICRDISLLFK